MIESRTRKISFRLESSVCEVLERLARKSGIETNAYIQRILKLHATESGIMENSERVRIELSEAIIEAAVERAQKLDNEGKFNQDFVLTVFVNLLDDPTFRANYEQLVGGDAYQSGLPGKSPINMYLGWYIKNAVGADPVLDGSGKPRRVQVREQAIQTYTLLKRPTSKRKAA